MHARLCIPRSSAHASFSALYQSICDMYDSAKPALHAEAGLQGSQHQASANEHKFFVRVCPNPTMTSCKQRCARLPWLVSYKRVSGSHLRISDRYPRRHVECPLPRLSAQSYRRSHHSPHTQIACRRTRHAARCRSLRPHGLLVRQGGAELDRPEETSANPQLSAIDPCDDCDVVRSCAFGRNILLFHSLVPYDFSTKQTHEARARLIDLIRR